MTTHEEEHLDQMFAEMASETVIPSEGLMDRIMLDADQVLAAAMQPAALQPVQSSQGFGAAFLEAIGGWMSFGGLSAAAMTGLWIGVFPPDALSDFSADYWGSTIEVPLFESDVLAGLEG